MRRRPDESSAMPVLANYLARRVARSPLCSSVDVTQPAASSSSSGATVLDIRPIKISSLRERPHCVSCCTTQSSKASKLKPSPLYLDARGGRQSPSATSSSSPLSVGDRVVWLSDAGPEWGWVRWMGRIDDERPGGAAAHAEVHAGVEFVSSKAFTFLRMYKPQVKEEGIHDEGVGLKERKLVN